MKFLFIVQGEGRGHLTQALTLEEHLRKEGHEIVEVLVGKSRTRELPEFFRKKLKAPLYRFESPNFLPTPANQRNNLAYSTLDNKMRFPAFIRSIAFQLLRIAHRNDIPFLSTENHASLHRAPIPVPPQRFSIPPRTKI